MTLEKGLFGLKISGKLLESTLIIVKIANSQFGLKTLD